MDPEDMNEVQNDQEVERMAREVGRETNRIGKRIGAKANQGIKEAKNAIRRKIPFPIRLKIYAGIAIGVLLLVGIAYIVGLFGENEISDTAVENVVESQVTIEKAGNDDYYYKIDKDVISEFKKQLNNSFEDNEYYTDLQVKFNNDQFEKLSKELKEKGVNTENEYDESDAEFNDKTLEGWFGTEDKETIQAYLAKMLRTEIASSYPKLSDYDGEDFGLFGNKKNKELGNKKDSKGNYAVQGLISIKRTKVRVTDTLKTIIDLPQGNGNATTKMDIAENGMRYIATTPKNVTDNLPVTIYLPGDDVFDNYLIGSDYMNTIMNGGAYGSEDGIFIVADYTARKRTKCNGCNRASCTRIQC